MRPQQQAYEAAGRVWTLRDHRSGCLDRSARQLGDRKLSARDSFSERHIRQLDAPASLRA